MLENERGRDGQIMGGKVGLTVSQMVTCESAG